MVSLTEIEVHNVSLLSFNQKFLKVKFQSVEVIGLSDNLMKHDHTKSNVQNFATSMQQVLGR